MNLKMSANLRKILEENKEVILDKSSFRVPTDEDLGDEEINVDKASLEEIKKYVREHTSGVREHYDLAEGGVICVSFPKFVEMINEGYNIYQSEVLSNDLISIRYQKEIKCEGRGR